MAVRVNWLSGAALVSVLGSTIRGSGVRKSALVRREVDAMVHHPIG